MTKKEREKELRSYPAALTVAETAEILRVSTKTVYKMIKENTLPAVKVGRENRIAKSNLIDYLQQRDKKLSNPCTYFVKKSSDKVWTFEEACDIVRLGAKPKNRKGVINNVNEKQDCSQRAG